MGFVFEHFALVFECLHPEYSLHPSFGLWRFMQKMWVAKMRRFHPLTNPVYAQLFLAQLEDDTARLIAAQPAMECEPDSVFKYDWCDAATRCSSSS